MPYGSRKLVMNSASDNVRCCSGILISAMASSGVGLCDRSQPARCFEQKFQNLDMTSCLGKIVAPSVQPVLPQQKGVRRWKSLERLLHLTSEALHILVVFQNRQPLDMLVGGHAFEPLEHLVAGDGQAPLRRMYV